VQKVAANRSGPRSRVIFSSDAFIFLFLPAWLVLFFLFEARLRRWINWLVLSASILFYVSWSWDFQFLPILLFSIAGNYIFVYLLKRGTGATKPTVALGVIFNLTLLGWYKYWCFFGDAFGLTVCDPRLAAEHLPLAISFFTFQQIAYLVDIYRHKEAGKNVPHIVDYAAFVSFFPHLIAGPITRSNELLKPIEEKAYRITAATLEIGLFVFFVGFAKKLFLADPLTKVVDPIFAAAETGSLDSLTAAIGVIAFTLQIYFDFSGYSEMAVGLGLMVGIQLPWNFATPYAAASVVDFWRRWHITLSTILRDYLYISLGGNRNGEFRKHVNLMATMVLGGLWHGANWTFVVWGALHGGFLIGAHLYRAAGFPRLPIWMAIVLTNLVVAFAWIFFRAQTFTGAANMIGSFGQQWDVEAAAGYLNGFREHLMLPAAQPSETVAGAITFLALGYVVGAAVRTQDLMTWYKGIMQARSTARFTLAITAAWAISYGLFLQAGAPVEFIYFDF
jgi:D-alanyl-lipoteichoic acid acyltransferase DltB (MBOAT superfamily)